MTESLRSAVEADLDSGSEDELELDVAVVGGGVSGLYTAFRLDPDRRIGGKRGRGGKGGKRGGGGKGSKGGKRGDTTHDVQVFECSDRIGGRLESTVLPGMEIAGELGGMRYIPSQKIVATLVEDIFRDELTWTRFPMGSPGHHLRYFRQQRFRADAWRDAGGDDATTGDADDDGSTTGDAGDDFQTRYALGENDGFSPDYLFNKIVYEVLTADPWFEQEYGSKVHKHGDEYEFDLTRKEWNDVKRNLTYEFEGPYQGMAVAHIGFWNLIVDLTSQETFEFLADAGGYYSNTLNWNAAEALPYVVSDFTGTVHYRTIEDGYDLLAYALAKAVQDAGSTIWSQNRLLGFDHADDSDRRYALRFENGPTGTEWTVYADQVVLAMPRRSIELLDLPSWFDPTREERVKELVESVIIEPSYKILAGFEYPWWNEDFGAKAGESITDLPMRQCYYFGTDPDDAHSLFLASYNDMRTVPFWRVLQDAKHMDLARFEPRTTEHVDEEDLDAVRDEQAPKVMVEAVMEQVRELHGLDRKQIPDPYITYYKDWSQDPFGGGYHAWKAGVDVRKTMHEMRKPLDTESIHVCGEAYSDQQGWVEGAFCVAERMLQDHFDLDRPEWLDSDYYLGW